MTSPSKSFTCAARILPALFAAALVAVPPSLASDVNETDILKTMDRRPLAVSFRSAAGRDGDVVFATSGGMLVLDSKFRGGQLLAREPVTAAAWDEASGRWVASGNRGLWREDIGWFRAIADDGTVPNGPVVTMTSSNSGIVLTTPTELWRVRGENAKLLMTDTGGLFGRPAVSDQEIAVVGFWSLHLLARFGASYEKRGSVPIPAELRADIPLGAAHIGGNLVVIGRKSGVYILSSDARRFPQAIPPPPIDESHREMGFPAGWVDFAVRDDELYVMSADGHLHTLSLGRPLRRISGWPAPAIPYRVAALSSGAVLLYADTGNSFLLANGPAAGHLDKYNLMTTSAGEVIVRRGLPPEYFTHRSRGERIQIALAWTAVSAAVAGAFAWSVFFGMPLVYRWHPNAGAFRDRLAKLCRDRDAFMQSLARTGGEMARMRRKASDGHEMDDAMRKNFDDRIRALSESRDAVIDNLRHLARRAVDEGRRIRDEGAQMKPAPGAPPPGFIDGILAKQTKVWERKFAGVAREIESILKQAQG